MFCYLRIAGVTQVNSDGAGLMLQASDMLHGNVLLHGWWADRRLVLHDRSARVPDRRGLPPASARKWSTSAPRSPTRCSCCWAAFVARGRARGAEGLVRALLAAGLILAPQPTGPTIVLLGSPDHVGTGVPVLVLLLLLDWAEGRRGRRRWYVPVAAGVLLAWSIIGDPCSIEVIGVLPCSSRVCSGPGWIVWSRRAAEPESGQPGAAAGAPRRAGRRAGAGPPPGTSGRSRAAVASVPVAAAGNRLVKALGGYNMANPFYHLQSLYEIRHGLPVAVESVLVLFGADFKSVTGAGNVAFASCTSSGWPWCSPASASAWGAWCGPSSGRAHPAASGRPPHRYQATSSPTPS